MKEPPHSSIDDAFNTARIFIEVYEKLPIDIEPFVSNQLLDNDYRKLVNKVVHLREKLGLNYDELSLVSKIKEEELEKIELFQLTKGKKEIKSLIQILYSIRGETIGKK